MMEKELIDKLMFWAHEANLPYALACLQQFASRVADDCAETIEDCGHETGTWMAEQIRERYKP